MQMLTGWTKIEMKRVKFNKRNTRSAATVRASISPDVYGTLEVIVKEKKVSLAWVVREATEMYIAEQGSLLRKSSL